MVCVPGLVFHQTHSLVLFMLILNACLTMDFANAS
jgi:hypothetical protein